MSNVSTPPGPGKGGRSRISGIIGPTDDDSHAPSDRVWLWSPVGFDPGEYLPPDLRRYGDCARFLLHRIVYARVFDRSVRGPFVPLKAAYLRRFFPGDHVYKAIRDCVIEREAVECDDRYIKGEKALGYRLGADLAARRQHRVEVRDHTLARKIRDDRQDRLRTTQGVHRHLYYNLTGLKIDYAGALAWLTDAGLDDPSFDLSAQMIRDGDFFWTSCKYGRFHTNLSNLKRELRGFLTHKGSPLVNLDVANAQPLVFGTVLMKRFEGGPPPADVRHYLDLVQSGRFYEFLMAEWGIPAEGRDDFKHKVYAHIFYCEGRPETKAARAFGGLFPNVYRVILEMKAGNARDAYKAFAQAMQRAESDLMIGGVAVRCMNEMPRTVLLTIHDSVVTTPDQADTVRSVMLDVFGQVGLHPKIKIENLKPPKLSDGC